MKESYEISIKMRKWFVLRGKKLSKFDDFGKPITLLSSQNFRIQTRLIFGKKLAAFTLIHERKLLDIY